MQGTAKKIVNIVLALSLFAAFVCALSLSSSHQSSLASVAGIVAPEATAAPVANRVDISFRNSRGQEIGEGRPFPLDRVARGEQFSVQIRAQRYPICIQVRAANGFRREVIAHGEFRVSDRVPTNPSFDDVTVTVLSLEGHRLAHRRLPIGRK